MGLDSAERGGVFHLAAGIARCELKVHDDGIVGVLGVDFAEEMAAQHLVLAGLAERLPTKGRGFAALDDDAGNAA